MSYQENHGQTLPSCKQGAVPSFAPSSPIKELECSFPSPMGCTGHTQRCNHAGSKPVAGNHRLDANHLLFHTNLFGQGGSCLRTLLNVCCPAAGTTSFPTSLSANKTYQSNRHEVMVSSSGTMDLQTVCPCPSAPARWQERGWCSAPGGTR